MFEITVDLAVGYTLNMAENFQPKLKVSFFFFLFSFLVIDGLDNK